MKILIAEDDLVSRKLLESHLRRWGYEVFVHGNGREAFEQIKALNEPVLAILDWMMPEMDGPEICRLLRSESSNAHLYLILLTSKEGAENTVEGLDAGADDYVTKPFNAAVLHARVRGGLRLLELQAKLSRRVQELEEALAQVKRLQGLLPICSYCKKVRNDQNYWQEVDMYLTEHTSTKLSHGFCPACFDHHIKPQLDELRASQAAAKETDFSVG